MDNIKEKMESDKQLIQNEISFSLLQKYFQLISLPSSGSDQNEEKDEELKNLLKKFSNSILNQDK